MWKNSWLIHQPHPFSLFLGNQTIQTATIVTYGVLSSTPLSSSTQPSISISFSRCSPSHGPLLVCRKSVHYYCATRNTTSPHLSHTISIYSSEFPDIQGPIYFNRTDVKKAIHAPLDVDWVPCSANVFNTSDGDESLPPAFTVLPSVIERNLRTVIVHGLADFVLIAEGFVFIIFFFSFGELILFYYVLGQESWSKSMFFFSSFLKRTLWIWIRFVVWPGMACKDSKHPLKMTAS